MAILDYNTKYTHGVNGTVNNMTIAETRDGKTKVQFLHYKTVTDNHVDEAEIVGEVNFSRADLENFNNLLTNHLKNLPN